MPTLTYAGVNPSDGQSLSFVRKSGNSAQSSFRVELELRSKGAVLHPELPPITLAADLSHIAKQPPVTRSQPPQGVVIPASSLANGQVVNTIAPPNSGFLNPVSVTGPLALASPLEVPSHELDCNRKSSQLPAPLECILSGPASTALQNSGIAPKQAPDLEQPAAVQVITFAFHTC